MLNVVLWPLTLLKKTFPALSMGKWVTYVLLPSLPLTGLTLRKSMQLPYIFLSSPTHGLAHPVPHSSSQSSGVDSVWTLHGHPAGKGQP